MTRQRLWGIQNTRLARRRIEARISQEDLAGAIGLGVVQYRRLETGAVDNPKLRYLVNLAYVLGCELDDLIEDEWREWKQFRSGPPSPPARALPN